MVRVRVKLRVRVRHKVRIRVPFRPITVRPPFRSVNYHILVKSGTRRSRSVPPFRSVPEIIPTQSLEPPAYAYKV